MIINYEDIKSKKKVTSPNGSILYVCFSHFHILHALIRTLRDDNKVDLILTDQIKNCLQIYKKINDLKIFNQVTLIHDQSIQKKYFGSRFYRALNILNFKQKLKSLYQQINFDSYNKIYIFFDRQIISQYLLETLHNICIIEDSPSTPAAFSYNKSVSRKIFEKLNLIPKTGGEHKNIDEILCSSSTPISKFCKAKITHLNYNKIFQCNKSEVSKLQSAFNLPQKILCNSPHKTLIMTQPLYHDKLLPSKKYQLNLYEKICKTEVLPKSAIYIKPHPRDNIDYSHLGARVLDRFIPSELYEICGLKFSTTISLFSTSIVKGVNNIKLGYTYDPLLKARYLKYRGRK